MCDTPVYEHLLVIAIVSRVVSLPCGGLVSCRQGARLVDRMGAVGQVDRFYRYIAPIGWGSTSK